MAISFSILKRIRSGDAKQVFDNLTGAIAELAFTEEQSEWMSQNAWKSYQTDGGAALLREAFGTKNVI
jgi:hypothetical protein